MEATENTVSGGQQASLGVSHSLSSPKVLTESSGLRSALRLGSFPGQRRSQAWNLIRPNPNSRDTLLSRDASPLIVHHDDWQFRWYLGSRRHAPHPRLGSEKIEGLRKPASVAPDHQEPFARGSSSHGSSRWPFLHSSTQQSQDVMQGSG